MLSLATSIDQHHHALPRIDFYAAKEETKYRPLKHATPLHFNASQDFMTIGDSEKERQLVGFILRLLRHSPEQAGLRMHPDGWIDKKSLLNYLRQQQPETQHWTLSDLCEALAEVVDPECLGEWFQTPNDSFDGLKPIEVIQQGEIDQLWNMVFELQSGMPG